MRNRTISAPLVLVAIGLGLTADRPCPAQAEPKAPAQAGEGPRYALVTTAAKRVRGALTVLYRAPKLEATEWAIYAARPPELPGQLGVRAAITPRGVAAREMGEEGRALLATRVVVDTPRRRTELEVRVDYEATLLARKLVPLAEGEASPRVAPLDPKERRLASASGHQFDFKSRPFQEWLDAHKLRREAGEGDVDLARRIFLEVKKSLPLGGDKPERFASRIVEADKTDGAGLVIVLVAALRADDIPARLLAGRRAESSGVEPLSRRPYDPLHIRAEFYARGVGWVPADIISAVARDETPEGLRYFGTDEGDFLAFHAGTDFVLETYFGPKTVEWLQDPSFWVLGGGTFDGVTTRAEWKVTTEPVDPAEAAARKPAARASTKKSRTAPAPKR